MRDVALFSRVRTEESKEEFTVIPGIIKDAGGSINGFIGAVNFKEGSSDFNTREDFVAWSVWIALVERCNFLCREENHFWVIPGRFHGFKR